MSPSEKLAKAHAAYERVIDELAKAINAAFPVGSSVAAWMSRGYMRGVVVAESKSCHDGDVIIRSDNSGRVHRKHHSMVKRV